MSTYEWHKARTCNLLGSRGLLCSSRGSLLDRGLLCSGSLGGCCLLLDQTKCQQNMRACAILYMDTHLGRSLLGSGSGSSRLLGRGSLLGSGRGNVLLVGSSL